MKRFKTKKIKKRRLIKYFFIFFFLSAYFFAFRFCANLKDKIHFNILDNDIDYINMNIKDTLNKKIENKISKPTNFLEKNIKKIVKVRKVNKVSKNNSTKENEEKTIEKEDIFEPIIYIYNTHQSEKYSNYSVYDAAYELTKKLNQIGLNSILEEQSTTVFLQQNNLKYYKSYEISKKFMNEAKTKYENLTYFFDIHRDSLSKSKTTINYNNINYAKILFVVGLDNKNYESNYNNALALNNIILKKVPGLTKGIMKKQGAGVNGVYNQDFSPNVFLIEIGGTENTKEEVLNSINVLYEAIAEYIRGVV